MREDPGNEVEFSSVTENPMASSHISPPAFLYLVGECIYPAGNISIAYTNLNKNLLSRCLRQFCNSKTILVGKDYGI